LGQREHRTRRGLLANAVGRLVVAIYPGTQDRQTRFDPDRVKLVEPNELARDHTKHRTADAAAE
jgi:hypothetical protein